jgi:hypothetical protein
MENTKKVLSAGGIAALIMAGLIMFTVFSCFFLPTDDFARDGWYIKLNIDPGSASKAINVTEYTVTELLIEVCDPDEQLIQTIHWYAGDGEQTYLIPVQDQGQYGIQVTHIGEKDGDEYEAVESAAFNMQAMTITVIDIIPGFIGEINIEPGDEEPIVQLAGTWINPDYDGTGSPAKTITTDNGDGTFAAELYAYVSDTVPMATITVVVTDQWTDSEDNYWLNAINMMGDVDLYQLTKIHSDGQTLETTLDDVDYPTEIDPSGWYSVYYRP